MAVVFNPPPGWPAPAPGWQPPTGWLPDPSWPPAPPDWEFWTFSPSPPDGAPAGSRVAPSLEATGDVAEYGGGAAVPPAGFAAPDRGTAVETVHRTSTASLWGWGGLAVSGLLGLTSGVGGALLFAGLFVLVVAVVALARGRVRWAHLATRSSGAAALVAAIAAVSIGAAVSPAAPTAVPPRGPEVHAASATSSVEAARVPAMSTTPVETEATPPPTVAATDPVAAAIRSAPPGSALAMVGSLVIRGRGSMSGYSRAAFGPAWTDIDRNGCDQRNDTLRRDLHGVELKAGTNGCAVMLGILTDPYTGTSVAFSRTASPSSIQIDHVVPLANAWATGAAQWTQDRRVTFANDSLNLVAVSATANASKGAGDAATWLPPAKAYRCAYLARQVAVKSRYELAVTPAERVAMVTTLRTCAMTTPPVVAVAKLGGFPVYAPPKPRAAPQPSSTPGPAPLTALTPKVVPTPARTRTPSRATKPVTEPAPRPTPQPTSPSRVQGVHPGSFCSPEGALGFTVKGTLMRCSFKTGDIRARWRSA
jgi:hypothetical protein